MTRALTRYEPHLTLRRAAARRGGMAAISVWFPGPIFAIMATIAAIGWSRRWTPVAVHPNPSTPMKTLPCFVARRAGIARFALLLTFTCAAPHPAAMADAAAPLPIGEARDLGFAPERLDRLHAQLSELVKTERCSGFVTLLVRHGQIADWRAHGYRDLATRAPMEKDTIVRLYSNTKIVTSVAAMILFEEGRLDLDAPIAVYLPQFKSLNVLTGGTADAPEVTAAKQPVRVRHLLSHTAGFATPVGGNDVLTQIYAHARLFEVSSLDEYLARLAALPLAHQPGTAFRYGVSTDVLGAIIEHVSGQSLEQFCQERIFRPLKMVDTSFDVAAEKMPRLAKTYERSREGGLVEVDPVGSAFAEPGRGFASGAGGLFSTGGDYARCAQMLLNGGELDGVRLLGRKTIEYMRLNHLERTGKPTHGMSPSRGFGLGFEVVIDPARDGVLCSPGQFGWYGLATTYCQIDPHEDLVAIAFFQHFPMTELGVPRAFANGYNSALVD